ncbi:MAG: DUF4331 family protein [Bacteroidota bacterium]|nr:DUF4331 family protein [Bacteroidota bacterium]
MKKKLITKVLGITCVVATAVTLYTLDSQESPLQASSHREAPLIANDPLADNTDLYAFRSPDDTTNVTIIANYVPLELPQGGPNYASFGTNIRYEIHIENGSTVTPTIGDDITYRFTFSKVNEDTTTFFNIRLNKENLKTTYMVEKSTNGGPFLPIVTTGTVPPANIGPRSIGGAAGLSGATYTALMAAAIATATGGGGEKIFCGPVDDPFFVDLGGIFDLGQTRAGGTGINKPEDGVACKNVHTIALKIPISTLQQNGLAVSSATNILDSRFIIGVWASASRQQIRTLNTNGTESYSGTYVQVSRVGMPLTNEAVIPIGSKDVWNSKTPYTEIAWQENYFCNPELALYLGNNPFASAVPALSTSLRTQTASLGTYNFSNGAAGLSGIPNAALVGTALHSSAFGAYLLRPAKPRSVDILPIFHTGVPNLIPYQLASGKTPGNPLSAGKPFINNFLPLSGTTVGGDMLRLNMAVPVTQRNDPNFSSLGLVQAAVLGLTTPSLANSSLQWIPNMDGFPNGRRLEDDVTRIELQAVGGVVLAAIGLWYDDCAGPTYTNVLTPQLLATLGYSTGIQNNDTTFKANFPYCQTPWSGYGKCGGPIFVNNSVPTGLSDYGFGISAPKLAMVQNYPNPFKGTTTFKYHLSENSPVTISIYDLAGKKVGVINEGNKPAGTYEVNYHAENLSAGIYIATLSSGYRTVQSIKISVVK